MAKFAHTHTKSAKIAPKISQNLTTLAQISPNWPYLDKFAKKKSAKIGQIHTTSHKIAHTRTKSCKLTQNCADSHKIVQTLTK